MFEESLRFSCGNLRDINLISTKGKLNIAFLLQMLNIN